MAALFIDLDGTFFKWGTNEPNEGWVKGLKDLQSLGHQIVFVTYRSDVLARTSNHPEFSPALTDRTLKDLGIEFLTILFGVESPRFIMNDDGAFGIPVQRDEPFDRNRVLGTIEFSRIG